MLCKKTFTMKNIQKQSEGRSKEVINALPKKSKKCGEKKEEKKEKRKTKKEKKSLKKNQTIYSYALACFTKLVTK